MLTLGINLKNFKIKKKNLTIKKNYNSLINETNEILSSFKKTYVYNYKKKDLIKFKKFNNFRVIGMGGSSLGAQAIYDFLHHKIKKNFEFINNLQPTQKIKKKNMLI